MIIIPGGGGQQPVQGGELDIGQGGGGGVNQSGGGVVNQFRWPEMSQGRGGGGRYQSIRAVNNQSRAGRFKLSRRGWGGDVNRPGGGGVSNQFA